jgi:hypothetical protein
MFSALNRDQHDHENEQHQNPADVHDDLDTGEKLRMKRQKDSCDCEECGSKEGGAVDNVALGDYKDRGNDRDRRKNVKENKF